MFYIPKALTVQYSSSCLFTDKTTLYRGHFSQKLFQIYTGFKSLTSVNNGIPLRNIFHNLPKWILTGNACHFFPTSKLKNFFFQLSTIPWKHFWKGNTTFQMTLVVTFLSCHLVSGVSRRCCQVDKIQVQKNFRIDKVSKFEGNVKFWHCFHKKTRLSQLS